MRMFYEQFTVLLEEMKLKLEIVDSWVENLGWAKLFRCDSISRSRDDTDWEC